MRTTAENIVIDGNETTIGLASAYYLSGFLDDNWNILGKIVGVLIGSGQEGEVDYFEVIRDRRGLEHLSGVRGRPVKQYYAEYYEWLLLVLW